MIQVAVVGVGELEGPEADVVESLVIDTHDGVGILNQLVDGEGCVVGFNDGVGYLGRGHDGESAHHPVRIFLTNLRDQEGTHARTGTTSQRVADLETLKKVASLSFLADNVEDGIYKLRTLSVVTLCPVVTGTRLAENEVVGSEELSQRTRADGIHRARFQVNKDSARNIFA